MQDSSKIYQLLNDVKDPEIPVISIVEMGMIHQVKKHEETIYVQVMPTFMGCPALEMIQKSIQDRLIQDHEIHQVKVEFIRDPLWTSDRITPTGREKLVQFGLAPPPIHNLEDVGCPYCQATGTDLVSLFGSTACRSIYYCRSCKEPFEAIKSV